MKRPRGWGGVSFRGIDVLQYSPDAVDTPICNDLDTQSLPSRETASRKCAKADLIQTPFGLSAHFRTSPEVSEKDSVMGLTMYEFS